MVLAVYFGFPFVGIYGPGVVSNNHGITVVPNRYKFGTIYQIGGDADPFQVGNVVMFKEDDVECRLTWDGVQTTVVPAARVVLTEYYT
jgi:hypothetical protein